MALRDINIHISHTYNIYIYIYTRYVVSGLFRGRLGAGPIFVCFHLSLDTKEHYHATPKKLVASSKDAITLLGWRPSLLVTRTRLVDHPSVFSCPDPVHAREWPQLGCAGPFYAAFLECHCNNSIDGTSFQVFPM